MVGVGWGWGRGASAREGVRHPLELRGAQDALHTACTPLHMRGDTLPAPAPPTTGNYTVDSDRGSAIVEINGKTQPLTGALGTIGFLAASSQGSGRNFIKLHSEGGDVQLSQLPSLL